MTFWQKLSKVEDYIHKYWYYAASPLVIGFIFINYEKTADAKKELEANLETTVGRVKKITPARKSRCSYTYEFQVNGKNYIGHEPGYWSNGVRVGNFYQVEYSSIGPENNRLNFDFQYTEELKVDVFGKVIDTVYTLM